MAKKKKSLNTNNLMLVLLVITAVVVCGALGFNIYSILNADTGEGTTDTVQKVSNEYSNDYYTIGNNPTDVNDRLPRPGVTALSGSTTLPITLVRHPM